VVIVLVGADDASRRAFELQVGDDADVALERLDGADRTDAGQTMPSLSWLCSITACSVRVTPTP
jgi:hypothetical protein